MTKMNVVSAVMDMTMMVHSAVTEGEGKSDVVATKVAAHSRRGAFAPQREGESFAQYQERLRTARMAEAERKRTRRAALKTGVFNRAFASVMEHGTDREVAVIASVPVKELHTRAAEDVVAGLTTRYRPFSKAMYRRGHYDNFVVDFKTSGLFKPHTYKIGNQTVTAPFSWWSPYHAQNTRDMELVRESLDNHFTRVAWRRNVHAGHHFDLSGTVMEQRATDEHVYRAMNAAQRSKANPLLHIGVTPERTPYVNTFVPASPAPFTQTERLDHSRVAPVAGMSDKTVEKHAPSVIRGTDGKVTHTYGGSVPAIPSDMNGLWCDRDRAGVYGSGQSDIPYRPVLTAEYHQSHAAEYAQGIHGPFLPVVIDDSPRDITRASLFVPGNVRFERKVTRELHSRNGNALLCAVVANGRKRVAVATGNAITANQFTVCSYPRLESCYR